MIPRRNVEIEFDPTVVPRDWYDGDPFVTTHLNALSLLFPEGERFFVDSVKQLRHLVHDPELRERITGFIGQEAMHGKEHRELNKLIGAPEVDAWLRGFLQNVVKRVLSPHSQLAATVALEHFTAIMAEGLLRRESMRAPMHESVASLWTWHALEESEHKAVAFDVYRAAGGGYLRRVGIMLVATVIFFAVTIAVQLKLLRKRGMLWKPWRWMRGIARLWIWPGEFTRMIPAYLGYFRPGFHPDDRDTSALVEEWREHLFGVRGLLSEQLRAEAA
jgi:predicted metal-dependent hydrolase